MPSRPRRLIFLPALLLASTFTFTAQDAGARGHRSARGHARASRVAERVAFRPDTSPTLNHERDHDLDSDHDSDADRSSSPDHDHDRAAPRARARVAWLRAHAPAGATIDEPTGSGQGEVTAVYVTRSGDTLASIARALLPLSETYLWDDFARELVRATPALRAGVKEGMRITVPDLVREAHARGDEARLGWPHDHGAESRTQAVALRGVYMRGSTAAGRAYIKILDKMTERGINAIVLDTKDTDGLLTYPSKVALAVETGATRGAPIADLARTIRFAHARGIRVVMRVSCFHDEWMQHHKGKEMSIRGKWGGIYPIGWLDPASEAAHQYVIALAKEAMDAGADEVELDYVRYPVIGIKNADFHLDTIGKTKPEVIRDFVRGVHEVTSARHVPLSLDIFGVVAEGKRVDIDGLGQDIALLGRECEVLSPMVYPSHYAKGYMGFEIPGNHPELVGIGTKGTVAQLGGAAASGMALVRPWVQAMYYESPDYGPGYLRAELKSAEDNGSSGWLMWNPQQEYGTAWAAVPVRKAAPTQAAPSQAAPSQAAPSQAAPSQAAPSQAAKGSPMTIVSSRR